MTTIQIEKRIQRARGLLKPCMTAKNLDLLDEEDRKVLINIHVKLNALYIAQVKRKSHERNHHQPITDQGIEPGQEPVSKKSEGHLP